MAKVQLQKVRIAGMKKHYKSLMQELHRSGVLHVIENKDFVAASQAEGSEFFDIFDLAKIEFMIEFFGRYTSKTSAVADLLTGGKLVISEEEAKQRLKAFSPKAQGIIDQCAEIEERLVKSDNEIKKSENMRAQLMRYVDFSLSFAPHYHTEVTQTVVGEVTTAGASKMVQKLHEETHLVDIEILDQNKKSWTLRVTYPTDHGSAVRDILSAGQFVSFDLLNHESEYYGLSVREVIEQLKEREVNLKQEIQKAEQVAKDLVIYKDEARILYDYNLWRKTKNDFQSAIYQGDNVFAFEAWMPAKEFKKLSTWITNVFAKEVSLEKIAKEKDEKEPVLLDNAEGVNSFEMITEMYGVPEKRDLDPTPYMAPFFVLFFGICLSDVGYGALLALFSGWMLIFGTFDNAMRRTMRLMCMCGVSAIVGGVLLGGWFAMTPEFAPSFLVNADGTFIGQILKPLEGNGPLIFLMFSMGIGIVQLLFSVVLDFVRRIRLKEYVGAFADPAAWFFFVVSLVGFAIADQVGLPREILKNMAIAGAIILVLTQGRDEKNWLLKPVMGVLGLYNIMNYLSDTLSYSRLMALGLATGVVGFAMNTTAGVISDMIGIPVISTLAAVVILVFGHGLNFGLSFLGAFIHSMRLQFIEFFGRFYVGGGVAFRPFARTKKYLHFRS